MIRARAALAAAAVLLLAACAGRGPSQRVDRNLITTEEMRSVGYADAFTAVQSLRPHWLNTRGPSSFTARETVKVYLDDSLMGGPEQLRQITTRSIASIRYLDGLQATQRWGLDHGLGAIVVSTRD